jgi:hypothetical protein
MTNVNWSWVILVLLVITLMLGPLACRRQPATRLTVGALYSVDDGEGHFRIAKILVLDRATVHVRLYANRFNERPATVDPTALTLGTIHDKGGFGIGHLPLARGEFAAWKPVFLAQASVNPQELEGYRLWKESQGGVFGNK